MQHKLLLKLLEFDYVIEYKKDKRMSSPMHYLGKISSMPLLLLLLAGQKILNSPTLKTLNARPSLLMPRLVPPYQISFPSMLAS
jgi:hypothetical protein